LQASTRQHLADRFEVLRRIVEEADKESAGGRVAVVATISHLCRMRAWARDHEVALVGFLRAYKAAVDWLYDRANRDVAEALLVANIRDMTPALARQSYDLLLADKGGLTRDLAIDPAGLRTVLELRSKYGVPQKTLTDPMKYVDVSYQEKALGKR
jgi:ABC-type nitrate/sulfonate/bicarbonate transport system substrate-binding protein